MSLTKAATTGNAEDMKNVPAVAMASGLPQRAFGERVKRVEFVVMAVVVWWWADAQIVARHCHFSQRKYISQPSLQLSTTA